MHCIAIIPCLNVELFCFWNQIFREILHPCILIIAKILNLPGPQTFFSVLSGPRLSSESLHPRFPGVFNPGVAVVLSICLCRCVVSLCLDLLRPCLNAAFSSLRFRTFI